MDERNGKVTGGEEKGLSLENERKRVCNSLAMTSGLVLATVILSQLFFRFHFSKTESNVCVDSQGGSSS